MYIFWIAGSTADYWNGSSNPTTTGNVTGVNSASTTAYYDDQVKYKIYLYFWKKKKRGGANYNMDYIKRNFN